MISRRHLIAAAGLAALARPARGQTLDSLGEAVVAAINGEADADLSVLIAAASLQRKPADQWRDQFAELRRATGGLDHRGTRRGPRELLVRVRARRQGIERDLVVLESRREPGRIAELFAIPRPAPYDGPRIAGPVPAEVLRAAIARRLETAAARDDFSGAVRVVRPDGEVLYEAAFGFADRARGERATPAHRFNLASADKSFTALMIGRAIEAGRLAFDTPVAEVLPAYANAEAARAITVRHLLAHQAGLGDLWSRAGYDGRRPIARVGELVAAFEAEAPYFPPGGRAAYSNEGFVLLGAMLEAVNGRPWWDQLADDIYAPAGMTRSGHFPADPPTPDRAIGYLYPESDLLGLEPRRPNTATLPYRGNSCGGGYSTVGDMTAYLAALSAGRLASPAMTRTLVTPVEGGLPDYALGFQTRGAHGRTLVGHSGGGPRGGVDGDSQVVWETGWAYSILGNYDAPFAAEISRDLGDWLAAQPA